MIGTARIVCWIWRVSSIGSTPSSSRSSCSQRAYWRIASALSPLRAAQFGQIEHRFNTAIDVMIASEVPLVKANGNGSNGAFMPQ